MERKQLLLQYRLYYLSAVKFNSMLFDASIGSGNTRKIKSFKEFSRTKNIRFFDYVNNELKVFDNET